MSAWFSSECWCRTVSYTTLTPPDKTKAPRVSNVSILAWFVSAERALLYLLFQLFVPLFFFCGGFPPLLCCVERARTLRPSRRLQVCRPSSAQGQSHCFQLDYAALSSYKTARRRRRCHLPDDCFANSNVVRLMHKNARRHAYENRV